MLQTTYFSEIINVLEKINNTQQAQMEQAGKILANTLEQDGLIHVFGSGHSHMVCEELFYRAGGVVNINPIFDTSVMLHEGAVKSSKIERMESIAPLVLDRHVINAKDCMLIISNSGINGYPIEMAISAKNKGIPTICITSFEYKNEPSNHSIGKHLSDICDLAINNYVIKGDASVPLNESGIKVGPISSIASFFIANSIMLKACEELQAQNITPKIFTSGNIKGGDKLNDVFIKEKIGMIKHL